ncbi:MAG: pilus assembly protein TadG-related protein [Pseudomonadota bacterium]
MITNKLRPWAPDLSGQTAIVFALMLVPILAVSGFAIDFSRQVNLKNHLQNAADAASLAGAKAFIANFSDGEATAAATETFKSNLDTMQENATCTLNPVAVSSAELTVNVTATCKIPTMLGVGVLGLSEVSVAIASTSAAIHSAADVVMMFDLSQSMSASDLADLKAAGKRAAEIVIGSQPGPRGRIAIAPFATGVNAGDFGNKASNRATGYDPEADNRANPFRTLERVCVTERVGPAAFTDAAPHLGDPVGRPLSVTEAGDLYRATGDPYYASISSCPDSPVHPLDDDLSAVKTAIDGLSSSSIANRFGGETSGHMGIAWSWYLISPQWSGIWTDPIFGGESGSDPHPYNDPQHPKIAILMTDGVFQQGFRHPFFSYNYTTQTDSVAAASRQLCANMRAEGIQIYAVGLDVLSEAESLLEDCTGDPDRVFTTSASGQLTTIYEEIARDFLGIGIVE